MQKGVAASVTLHAVAVIGVLVALAAPQPYETRPEQAIVVELVAPKEIPAPEKPQEPQADRETNPQSAPQQQSAPRGGGPAGGSASASQQAASQQPASQQAAQQQAGAAEPAQPLQSPTVSGFLDPGALLSMYNMRVPGSGFDAPAQQTAALAADDVARLRAHLRKCWRLPAGLSSASATQVVMRVALAESGALLAEPSLVSASASEDGPLVMRAAMQALEACQPFGFLPRERYREWKVLDISLSPRLMAGS